MPDIEPDRQIDTTTHDPTSKQLKLVSSLYAREEYIHKLVLPRTIYYFIIKHLKDTYQDHV